MGKKEEFVKNAKKYVGYGPATFRKWFYGSDKKQIPWCAIFVSYVANETGILGKCVVRSAGAGDFARLGVKNNFGKWYEGNTKPQAGDLILFTWNNLGRYPGKDAYFSDHVGIVTKVDSKYVYTIEGNTNSNDNDASVVAEHRYDLYSGKINGYFRPNWNDKLPPEPPTSLPDAIYCVRAAGKWYPFVKNLDDYAGVVGKEITDVAIKFSKGTCKYRVHLKGSKWLPWVTGCNIKDDKNGYAGDGKAIDAIQINYKAPADITKSSGTIKVQYRVSPTKGGYYSYQTETEKTNGQDGYAGSLGKSMDRLQITLVKK